MTESKAKKKKKKKKNSIHIMDLFLHPAFPRAFYHPKTTPGTPELGAEEAAEAAVAVE